MPELRQVRPRRCRSRWRTASEVRPGPAPRIATQTPTWTLRHCQCSSTIGGRPWTDPWCSSPSRNPEKAAEWCWQSCQWSCLSTNHTEGKLKISMFREKIQFFKLLYLWEPGFWISDERRLSPDASVSASYCHWNSRSWRYPWRAPRDYSSSPSFGTLCNCNTILLCLGEMQ